MAKFYKRAFLNPSGQGHFEFSVSPQGSGVGCEFTVADCGRSIALDFSAYLEDNRLIGSRKNRSTEKTRTKFLKFQKAVNDFGAALLEELDRLEGKDAKPSDV